MTRIRDKWACTIMTTWRCNRGCFGCVSGCSAIKRRDAPDMPLPAIREALESLDGYCGCVCAYGGEPTLHADPAGVADLFALTVPRSRAVYLTNGAQYDRYEPWIWDAFGSVLYCDHSTPVYHRPIYVAGADVIRDPKQVRRNIDTCYADACCTSAITDAGAYFCAVAAGLDKTRMVAGWPSLAVPVYPGWWKRDELFTEQRRVLCALCGLPHRLRSFPCNTPGNVISKSWRGYVRGPVTVWDYDTAEFVRNRVPYKDTQRKVKNKAAGNWTRRTWQMFLRQKLTAARYYLRHGR
jgi:hypothetical protein